MTVGDSVAASWKDKALFAVQVFLNPDRYLKRPEPGVGLEELLAVKEVVAPESADPATLLVHMLQITPLLFHHLGGNADAAAHSPKLYLERIKGPDDSPVRLFAGRVAGGKDEKSADEKKEQMGERLHAFLQAVDQAIIAQHARGAGHERLVFSDDFGDGVQSRGVHVPELIELQRSQVQALAGEQGFLKEGGVPDDFGLVVGFVEHLPASHPLKGWPREDYYVTEGKPAVLLGPEAEVLQKQVQGEWKLDGGENKWKVKGHHYSQLHLGPRPFYERAWIEHWTRTVRVLQLVNQKRDALRLSPDRFKQINDDLASLEPRVSRKMRPSVTTPAAVELRETWAGKTLLALEVFTDPDHYFTVPPPGTGIGDLLAVRDALRVNETDIEPAKDAARRLAGKFVGMARRDELIDLLANLLVGVDRLAAVELNKGLIWAANQAEKPAKAEVKGKAKAKATAH